MSQKHTARLTLELLKW